MRIYSIYNIEEKFARFFYGKENLIVDLFRKEKEKYKEQVNLIQKQIEYITLPIPITDIHQLLHQYGVNYGLIEKDNMYYLKSNQEKEGAVLYLKERSLNVEAWGSLENETIFFEILRKYDGHFLAIDLENNYFGWLKPVKERKFV